MGREKSRWLNLDEWVCPNHIPSPRYPIKLEKCWYLNCEQRPPMVERPVPNTDICAWHMCDKGFDGKGAFSRENSKYCSRDCSNKNARYRHKTRKGASNE